MQIVLASTSLSRQKILKKFGIHFTTAVPICDETPSINEDPVSLVLRLSQDKAKSVANNFTNSLIIGSDQVGEINGRLLGKPLTKKNAIKQLQLCSENTVNFYTGLCVLNTNDNQTITLYELYQVTFRKLTVSEIEGYIKKERPLNCAGSFKCDGLGITLLHQLHGNDINSLIGLPLIRLNHILISMGINPLLNEKQC